MADTAPPPAPRAPLSKERMGEIALLALTETFSHLGDKDALIEGQMLVSRLADLGVPSDEGITFAEELLRDAIRLAFTPRPKKEGTPEPRMHKPVPHITGHQVVDTVLNRLGIEEVRGLFREFGEQMRGGKKR